MSVALKIDAMVVLNENGLNGHICLNTRFTVGGSAWVALTDMALLEEVYHWGRTLKFQNTYAVSCVHSVFPYCRSSVSPQLLFQHRAWLPATVFCAMRVMDSPSKTVNSKTVDTKKLFYNSLWL